MIKLLSYHNWMVTSIAVILMSMLQGCAIIIPTPVRPEVQRIDDVVLNEDIYVTIGPRTLLKNVSDQIEKDRQNIIVEDPLLFRDTAFPEGGWLLKEFLDSQRCGEVVSQLGVEYLVLVGSRTTEEGEFGGFYVPLLVGAMSIPEQSQLSTLIINLKSQSVVCEYVATAESEARVLHYVVVFVGSDPMTESAVVDGIATSVAEYLSGLSGDALVRIAVLAAESKSTPAMQQ
jgi:hypothetical protein